MLGSVGVEDQLLVGVDSALAPTLSHALCTFLVNKSASVWLLGKKVTGLGQSFGGTFVPLKD